MKVSTVSAALEIKGSTNIDLPACVVGRLVGPSWCSFFPTMAKHVALSDFEMVQAVNPTNVTNGGACTGVVRSFSASTGWGFVTHQGEDVFVHVNNIIDGRQPVSGDKLQFERVASQLRPGKAVAMSVTGGSGGPITGRGKGSSGGSAARARGGRGGGVDPAALSGIPVSAVSSSPEPPGDSVGSVHVLDEAGATDVASNRSPCAACVCALQFPSSSTASACSCNGLSVTQNDTGSGEQMQTHIEEGRSASVHTRSSLLKFHQFMFKDPPKNAVTEPVLIERSDRGMIMALLSGMKRYMAGRYLEAEAWLDKLLWVMQQGQIQVKQYMLFDALFYRGVTRQCLGKHVEAQEDFAAASALRVDADRTKWACDRRESTWAGSPTSVNGIVPDRIHLEDRDNGNVEAISQKRRNKSSA